MVAFDLLHLHRAGLGQHATVAIGEVGGEIMIEPVPPRLPRQHDVEGRIAADPDPLHRVHLHGDGERVELGHRSEEHTSELQSLMRISYAVFCLKKKTYISYPRSRSPTLI